MNLENKVAIITGASAGLGTEFSRSLAAQGCIVYGTGRRVEKLEAIKREIGDAFLPLAGDVRKPEDVAQAISKVLAAQGRIDILVNNAGLGQFAPLDEMTLEQWDVQMDTNLRGVFLFSQAVHIPFSGMA